MSIHGEIIVIDDDKDELFIYRSIFSDIHIPNPVKYFEFPTEIFKYLDETKEQPFLIICDINMPLSNGFTLRERMLKNKNIRARLIPFVFVTNTKNEVDIFKAHDLFAFGLYRKRNDYNEQKYMIIDIINACAKIHRDKPGSTMP